MAEQIFIQLAIILSVAFLLSFVSKTFKQPIVLGYIIAGILIGTFGISMFGFELSSDVIETFSHFGIAFLLFMVGLHINPKVIREVGLPSLLIGLFQIALTFAIGFVIGWQIFRLDILASSYIGAALSFSSTIIVMKFLSDKKDLDNLYGKICIGVLIVQDLAAVAVLMLISSSINGTDFGSFALKGILGGLGLIVALFLFGFFILPRIIKKIAGNQELLFLFSLAWAFAVSALFILLGFSVEIGALIAGVVLSISPYSTSISSKIRPLRDFFLIIFFIIMGLNIELQNIGGIIFNALILSGVVFLFKPLILTTLSTLFGYTKRTNFLVGTTMAQISEFSLIVLVLGVSLGHISKDLLSTVTLTGLITITVSSYLIVYGDGLYKKMSNFISIFERKKIKKKRKIEKSYDAILFGYNRVGFNILKSLKEIKQDYLVVDYNPDIIENLEKMRIPAIYGDAFDEDFLDELPLDKLKLAVSTIPDFETNELLVKCIMKLNPETVIIARADRIKDALDLYKMGADYVLTPYLLGGEYVAKMITKLKTKENNYKKERKKHVKMLRELIKKM